MSPKMLIVNKHCKHHFQNILLHFIFFLFTFFSFLVLHIACLKAINLFCSLDSDEASRVYHFYVDINLTWILETKTESFCVMSREKMLRTSNCTFPAFHALPTSFQFSTTCKSAESFRYKILLEHYKHATVENGRRKNSIAASKSSRPSSELNVFCFKWTSLTQQVITFNIRKKTSKNRRVVVEKRKPKPLCVWLKNVRHHLMEIEKCVIVIWGPW